MISSAANGNEIELSAEVNGNYFVHMTSWDSLKDSTLAEAYMPILGRDPYTTITIDNTDDFDAASTASLTSFLFALPISQINSFLLDN